MPAYQFNLIDAESHRDVSESCIANSDNQAIKFARQKFNKRPGYSTLEIWQDQRLIYSESR